MSKQKSSKKSAIKVQASKLAAAGAAPKAVMHGDCFRTFLEEAHSVGSECVARREFDEDVIEYLRSKNMFDDWAAWREAKRTPKTEAAND